MTLEDSRVGDITTTLSLIRLTAHRPNICWPAQTSTATSPLAKRSVVHNEWTGACRPAQYPAQAFK